jgi:hypothetical protein
LTIPTIRGRLIAKEIPEGKRRWSRMKIRKVYQGLNPELLYDEVREFVQKQGATIGQSKMETYSLPSDSSSFVSRGTMTFLVSGGEGKPGKEFLRAHILGSVKGEVKLMLDIDDELFPKEKVSALQDDLEFILGPYEQKGA